LLIISLKKQKFINYILSKEFIGGKIMTQQRKTQTIPKAPVARILMKAGAKRVSADAAEEFADMLYDIGLKIGEKAVLIAKHSGRKTVHEGDIKLAARK